MLKRKALTELSGRLRRVVYPKLEEQFTGWAVVEIDGQRAAGELPFLDRGFEYRLRVRPDPQRPTQYVIESTSFSRLPVTIGELVKRARAAQLLRPEECYSAEEQLAAMLQHHDRYNVDVPRLLRETEGLPDWLRALMQRDVLFRSEYFTRLLKLWSARDLQQLTLEQLQALIDTLHASPFSLCFHWKHEFGEQLPELSPAQLALACVDFHAEPVDASLMQLVHVYGVFRRDREATKQIALSKRMFQSTVGSLYNAELCQKHQVIVQSHNIDPSSGESNTVLMLPPDLRRVRELGEALRALFTADTAELEWRKRVPPTNDLNPEQLTAFHAIAEHNFLLVLGDAGTGKTLLGARIAQRFKVKSVLPLAYYGRVASALRRKVSARAMTIHRLMTELRRGGPVADKLRADTQVVIIDECSVLTLELLHAVLSGLPRLRKLVLLGDEKQMPPPTPGAILPSLLLRYSGLVQRLRKIERVKPGRELLLRNFRRIADGQLRELELVDSGALADCPFTVRLVRPRNTGKLEAVSAELQEILAELPDIQIIAHRHEDCALLNKAHHQATRRRRNYDATVFEVGERVMFTQNNEGSAAAALPPPLRSDPVYRGELAVITEICDVDHLRPNYTEAHSRTDAEKSDPVLQRLLRFDDGRQVNLSFYPIGNLVKGTVSTIASMQGSEVDSLLLYVQPEPSGFFNRATLYTAVTRAKSQVVILCWRMEDLERIAGNLAPAPTAGIHWRLPPPSEEM
jgi:hypothetical protein